MLLFFLLLYQCVRDKASVLLAMLGELQSVGWDQIAQRAQAHRSEVFGRASPTLFLLQHRPYLPRGVKIDPQHAWPLAERGVGVVAEKRGPPLAFLVLEEHVVPAVRNG